MVYLVTNATTWYLLYAQQCKYHSWREGRADDDDWNAHSCWHFLCWVRLNCWMEICKIWIITHKLRSYDVNVNGLLVHHVAVVTLSLLTDSRRLHKRRPRSTRKENSFLKGIQSLLHWLKLSFSQFWKRFLMSRFKVLGPDGSSYLVSQEGQVSGSDADDAWSPTFW